IIDAALARHIPYQRLNRGSLVQFGFGSRQRRICTAETDRTGAIAESIAQDKQLTRKFLSTVGIPVPRGYVVTDAEDAWNTAEYLGLPVVVKPQFGNHGRGVATNLNTREQVLAAYAAASAEGASVIVETFAPGGDYRLLVVGDRLVAAAHREPAHVIGDGKNTVKALVEAANLDPRRSDGHATALSRIKIDAVAMEVLKEQGLTPDSIVPNGVRVLIRRNANLSTGGTATDVTHLVHPETARQAVEAARVIGLDIAGLDIVAQDIGRPLFEQRGVVVEVNAGPGLRMHTQPSFGEPRPVGEAIINMLYPDGQDGRIPIVAVTGVNGKTTTTRLVAHIMSITGQHVGMTCTDGIYISGRRIDAGDCSGPQSARSVLFNPLVDAAVFETARGGILREGLGFDRCDVAVVTNIGEGDHLGLADIDSIEKLAKVKRTVVEAVAPSGHAVLNADDPLVAEMATHCPGNIVYFAQCGEHPLVVKRRAEGGRVAFVRERALVLADGANEFALLSLDRIPVTHRGRIAFQVENVLAATAACWALGMKCEQIRIGLELFGAGVEHTRGRFNLFEIQGTTVVVDYGHNTSSLAALLQSLDQFPHERRLAVYSAAGDRRDHEMVRQGELLASAFDTVILYEDQYLRGRQPGEIVSLFRQGLSAGRRVSDIRDMRGWRSAAEMVMQLAEPGDLVLLQADTVDEAVNYLQQLVAEHDRGREIVLEDTLDSKPVPVGQSEM
ncbi:MAG: cyanophycin synthetase, partial [Planctomycetales bacterium]|nr:cyanophycin synthetase [Planctomycetales bacterium]